MSKFVSFCDKCNLLLFTEHHFLQHQKQGHTVNKIITVDKSLKKGYHKTMKKITINIEKTKDGYVLASEELGKINYFDDTDESRKLFIRAAGNLMMDLLNFEVDNGNKYD
jgi:hypothetical protein